MQRYAATVGVFDGVHLGHRHLIRQLCDTAAQHDLRSMVVTLTPHPRLLLTGIATPLLSTPDERTALLRQTGIDKVTTLHFSRGMAALTAREFIRNILIDELGVKLLVIGYDHHFGSDGRNATQTDYLHWATDAGIQAVVATRLATAENISSSAIRAALSEGNVRKAAAMLGRRYAVSGRIVTGAQVGRELGFPTANITNDADSKLLPRDGVYVTRVHILNDDTQHGTLHNEGEGMTAMTHIGTRPTIDSNHIPTIETHIIGFDGNLYGQNIAIEFIDRIRDTMHFANRDELSRQLQCDAAKVRALNLDL